MHGIKKAMKRNYKVMMEQEMVSRLGTYCVTAIEKINV